MRASVIFLLAASLACQRPSSEQTETLGPPPPAQIRRIVTLAPSLTDLVLELGARERLVGVTRYDDAPEVQALTRVGGYADPSAETILRLRPDLVLCQPSPGNKGAVEQLARSGIPIQVFRLESMADISSALSRMGRLLSIEGAAREAVGRLESARQRARTAASKRVHRPRVALLFDVAPLVAAGPGSYVDEMLTDAGATNVVDRAPQPFPTLPNETLLARKPEKLLLAPMAIHGTSTDGVASSLRTPTIELRSIGFVRPGPKVAEALDELTLRLDDAAAARTP